MRVLNGPPGWNMEVAICVTGFDQQRCGAGLAVLQPMGEISLLIRCRCSNERSPTQFVIVVRGNQGHARHRFSVRLSGLDTGQLQAVLSGRIGSGILSFPVMHAEPVGTGIFAAKVRYPWL